MSDSERIELIGMIGDGGKNVLKKEGGDKECLKM